MLNWYLTLRSFHYPLYVRCKLSWGRALGPFGGLSTGQLNCCLPRMEDKRRARREVKIVTEKCDGLKARNFSLVVKACKPGCYS